MLRPPKTNDPALNLFLEEVASTIQDRVRPEEGWTLSDFASSVSEVISDKRDLIDIVTKYDGIEELSGEMEAEVARLKSEIQDSIDLLSSIESKSAEFAEVMEWWDQNYKVIFSASEAMEIFGDISDALEGHQDILDQIAAATDVAEGVVTEVRAAEAAAKTSENNAADAASRAESAADAAAADAVEVDESRDIVVAVHQALKPGGEILENLNNIGASVEEAASQASVARDAAMDARDAAQGHADRAEAAAEGVDQVVADAAGVLTVELGDMAQQVADDADAAGAARDQAATKAGEAAASATLASTKADDAESSASTASNAAATVGSSIDAATTLADRAEAAALNAEASAAEASSVAGDAARAAAIHATAEEIQRLVGDAEVDLDTIYELASAVRENQDGLQALLQVIGNKAEGKFEFVAARISPTDTQPPNRVTFVMGPSWEPPQ